MTENAAATQSEQLNLKVKSQDGEEVFFKIKSSTQLKKLMDAYCQRQSVIFQLFSLMSATSASCLTESVFMKTKRQKNSIWKTEMRLM
jgi:hypothetical protein